jgi:CelD/BcsL family acetyltransferase involved in cellulose biosynthesis
MRLVVHRGIPESDDLQRQWNGLVQQMESPEVFYTYEWALAVSRAYSASLKPLLMLAYEEDRVVGIAALATDALEGTASFLAGSTADYCDLVCPPEKKQSFTSLILSEIRRLALDFIVANLPVFSNTGIALQRASHENGSSYFSRPAFHCAQTDLSSPERREAARRSMRNKKFDRQLKILSQQHGPVKFHHLTGGPEIAAALPEFRDVHIARFRAQGRSSNLADPRRWHFAQELAQLLSAQGWMILSALSVADQPIAWNYGFRFGGSWFWYQPTFDGNFSTYSPGLCLLARTIEDACSIPNMNRVDLGLGEEGYKERFATDYRDTVHITVSSSAVRNVREKLRYHAASAIKSSPHLEQCVRWLLRKPVTGGARA